MDALFQDLRTAMRSLRATPGFTAAVAGTLAIAIGANTLIFSVVNGVLLNPLAFRSPEGLVAVASPNGHSNAVSPPDFRDWREQVHRLSAIAAYDPETVNLTGIAQPVRLKSANVSANWFSLLGVAVEHGRAFAPEDDQVDPAKVVILSDALWRSRFGADPATIGRTLDLDSKPYTVIGIAPPTLRYPDNPDLWMPVTFSQQALSEDGRGAHFLGIIGRLAPGATFAGAQQEFVTVTDRLIAQHMLHDGGFHYTLTPLQEQIVGSSRHAILILFGAVGCVLLIACANVANLLLVRATGRANEISVRIALGASRFALMRQLLTESGLLAFLGGACGILLASAGIQFLAATHPGNLPRLDEVTLSTRVLLFTLVTATLSGLVFGILPAMQTSFKADMRGASAHRRSSRLRGGLVIAETALAVLLLLGAGLLTKSFVRTMAVDPGFVPEHVVRFDVNLPDAQYKSWAQLRGFTHGVLGNLERLPGTVAAAAAFGVPFGDVGARSTLHITGRPPDPPDHKSVAYVQIVTPKYFSAMGIPVRRGRTFTDGDRPGGHQVIVVNESLAKQYFAGEDPIGKTMTVGWTVDSSGRGVDTVTMGGEIVGIVGDTKTSDLKANASPAVYAAYDQMSIGYETFVVRTTAAPGTVLRAAPQAVAQVDPTIPLFAAGTFVESVRQSVAAPRLYATVVGAFALVALILAIIGIYGVLAYSVRERRRELGIRVALGAREAQVVGMVVGQGVRLAGAGLVLGFAVALMGGRVLATLLYGVRPDDPPTYEAVSVALLAVAALASWLPARRAAVIDPVIAMRPE
ncbi:MAG TPA: ABC transporter permease [Gemmatimonadaceae bacterium]|nr:ABC transporter permease [Gemmatimonadaceae bacterium]